MTVKGFFELSLKCDEPGCTTEDTYRDNTRLEAKSKARYQGWYISRANQTYCPTHREKYATWV